jgi:hypothetical protein
MFDSIKKAIIQNREDDALLYEYVLTEIENSVILKGLWAKAMALSEGNDNKIQPLYMQYRVQSIKDEFTKLNIAYKEMSKDPLFRKISSIYAEPTPIKSSQVKIEEKVIPVKKTMSDIDNFIMSQEKDTSSQSSTKGALEILCQSSRISTTQGQTHGTNTRYTGNITANS